MSGKAAPKFRTPLQQAKGWGSAKSGTSHFWWQRVTAVILALLVPYIVFMLACAGGHDAVALRALIAKPWNAIILSVFSIALFWHAKLGLQVVIEDYVHDRTMHLTLRILLILGSLVGVLSAIYAIARIAMTA